ncbi:MAG: hypothetical protein EXR75_11345 [Myxococcales bacterium]|nr:hypothetical protein [Myxococcales bacterium]
MSADAALLNTVRDGQGTAGPDGLLEGGMLEAMLAELRAEFPRFRIVPKGGDALSVGIDRLLKLITLGGQNSYLTRYHTVIGDTLYVPALWDTTAPIDRIITLRHERVHLRQRRRFTLIGMAAIYLFLPLPIGLAYGRARIEWEAYDETLRATLELRGEAALTSKALREHIVSQFTGGAYAWMWPFRSVVERWFDDAVRRLLASRDASRDPSVVTR